MCAATEHTLFEKWQYELHQEAGTAALNDIHYESFAALLSELPNFFFIKKNKEIILKYLFFYTFAKGRHCWNNTSAWPISIKSAISLTPWIFLLLILDIEKKLKIITWYSSWRRFTNWYLCWFNLINLAIFTRARIIENTFRNSKKHNHFKIRIYYGNLIILLKYITICFISTIHWTT